MHHIESGIRERKTFDSVVNLEVAVGWDANFALHGSKVGALHCQLAPLSSRLRAAHDYFCLWELLRDLDSPKLSAMDCDNIDDADQTPLPAPSALS